MDIHVREAKQHDLSFIFHANREMAAETEGKELDPLTLQRGIEAVLSDPTRGLYLVAECEGTQAGSLLVTSEWSDWRNGYFWWIQSVFVLPSRRGHGVYSALHREVVQRARENREIRGIRLYVDGDNSHARKVYEKLGMSLSNYHLMEQPLLR
ncbi:MAG: GNAT family N-acetyltransferase [Planctomycetota bacterium]